jgi:hypothetical protein
VTLYLATIRYEATNQQAADEVAASMVRLFAGWNASVVSAEPDPPEFCEHEPYRDDIPGEPYGAVAVRAMRVLRCRKCPAVSITFTGLQPPPLPPWQLDSPAPPVTAQVLSPALLDELRQMMREEAQEAVRRGIEDEIVPRLLGIARTGQGRPPSASPRSERPETFGSGPDA